jgi:hypothetical protein
MLYKVDIKYIHAIFLEKIEFIKQLKEEKSIDFCLIRLSVQEQYFGADLDW